MYFTDIKVVMGVQFSISYPEDIRKHSVVEVTKFETYRKRRSSDQSYLILVCITDRDCICGTCNKRNTNCLGHFGHIELARPVLNYHFIQTVVKLLKCTCCECSKLLIDKTSETSKILYSKSNKARWLDVYNLCSKVKCCGQETVDGCGAIQPDNYKIEGVLGIFKYFKEGNVKTLLEVEKIQTYLVSN